MKTTACPPILFIHGFRGSPGGMLEAFTALGDCAAKAGAAQLEIYAPELPPATSAGTLDTYTADAYADWVANYIKSHKLQRPILMGHSMGSLIVAATAEKYPELVNAKLILLAPVSQRTPRPIAALQPLVAILPNRTVSYVTTKYMFVHQADTPADTREIFARALSSTNAGGALYNDRRALAAAAKFPVQAVVGDFDLSQAAKVYIIEGDHDKLFKRTATEALAKKLNARLTILPNCGHLLNYERPRALADAIWAALKD